MTIDQSLISLTAGAMNARDERRQADMQVAIQEGRHFWVAMPLFRVSGPSDDVMLDAENICGYVRIHCAICGVETNDDPICHSIG